MGVDRAHEQVEGPEGGRASARPRRRPRQEPAAPLAAGARDVELRWRYRQALDDLYWYVDNLRVTAVPRWACATLACAAPPDEVSPPGSPVPLVLVKDVAAADCPGGACLHFETKPGTMADGYHVYEGAIGAWGSHQDAPGNVCAAAAVDLENGFSRHPLAASPGSRYYLVTAFNRFGEGTAGDAARDAGCSCPP